MSQSTTSRATIADAVVLIASAQERVQSACRQQIGNCDFQVASCHSAIDCLDTLRHNAIDVVILDVAIPWGGADGVLELLNGQSEEFKSRPSVFLVMTEVVAHLLYRVGRYHVDDFQIGLHDHAKLGARVRRLVLQRQSTK